MSSVQVSADSTTDDGAAPAMTTKLEVVLLPVSDVDRAQRFYRSLGWRLDADLTTGDDFRGGAADAIGFRMLDHLR